MKRIIKTRRNYTIYSHYFLVDGHQRYYCTVTQSRFAPRENSLPL